MKKTHKLLALFLSLVMLIGAVSVVGYAADEGVDYTITSTYADVDWSNRQYRTELHSHTTASDGNNTLKEMTEQYYDYGYDFYTDSDHGLVSYSWTEQQVISAMKVVLYLRGRGEDIETLLPEGGFCANGNTYDLSQNAAGDDVYTQTAPDGTVGHPMLRVPYGIELNPSSLNNAHVTSWFCDYGNAVMGGTSDYETAISGVEKAGGICVINHPGEYTRARHAANTAEAYDYNDTHYKYVIDKYVSLLEKHPCCLGIDMNSKGDNRTRHDRKLWDILLMRLAPSGRNVYGLATSDAHSLDAAFTGYMDVILPEQTTAALREALEKGQFFAGSKWVGNPEELQEIASLLAQNRDATSQTVAQAITEGQAADFEGYKYEASRNIEAPRIRSVIVNEETDTITIDADDALCVRWIADGKTVATGSQIDLDRVDGLGSYVRAEVFGEGGITYTVPMLLSYDGAPESEHKFFIDLWFLASFLPDTIVRFLASLPGFDAIWDALRSR